jgi:putative thymidine phosphorylase
MNLKIKNLDWLAGRPVVFLTKKTAQKMNVHVDERVCLRDGKKVFAVVDIFDKVVKDDEVGISHEVNRILNEKENTRIEVSPAEISYAARLIKKKLSGEKLSENEIKSLVKEIVNNNLTESEIAFFAAAEKSEGMTMKEVVYLTESMVSSGNKLHFNKKIIADKHCVGGIAGNRTTPIVVSICASAGLTIPKTSSRAITSASGTADVIETISNVELSAKELEKIVNKTGACLAWGGSLGLAPSDDKIIHVERLLNLDVEPQLLASIMSKKISAGSNHILIDIPYGHGAKFDSKIKAEKLGKKFQQLGEQFNIKVKIVATDGKQPIGNGIGPVLEMKDVLAVLQNKNDAPQDLRIKSLFLASELMSLCGIKNSKNIAQEILDSGKAYEKFKEIINAQNKSNNFDAKVKNLKLGKFKKTILSKKSGKIAQIDNKKINSLCRILGTPETISAGCYLYKHLGKVKKNEKLLTLYSESESKLKDALRFINESKPIIIK